MLFLQNLLYQCPLPVLVHGHKNIDSLKIYTWRYIGFHGMLHKLIRDTTQEKEKKYFALSC